MNPIVGSEQLRHIVEAAGLAPSVHNTQPWNFVARGAGLELRADQSRRLEVLDPDGRQLHLSCGAALLHARVAARALGLTVGVQILPDPSDPAHLADLALSVGTPSTPEEVTLATAMLKRHTHRGSFDGDPIPSAVLAVLHRDAEAEGAVLHEVSSEGDLVQLEVMLSGAEDMEQNDERYRAELAAWVRRGEVPADGIPVGVLTDKAAGSSLRQRDFTMTRPAGLDGSAPTVDHPSVVVLCTDGDDPGAWLRAGQALAAVLLRAADHGVQAQPLGQVTDVLAHRLGLRQALGLIAVPQLVLRMGFATRSPVTPRRLVEDVLVTVTD